MKVITGENLSVLTWLERQGQRFDLIELDGPYNLGGAHTLESGWDELTEQEYIAHYAIRLTVARELLHPWGVVYTFGYPEGAAEIKAWAHRTKTLYCRRWLTWYKQLTAHKGRKVESILLFTKGEGNKDELIRFGAMLKEKREAKDWRLGDVQDEALFRGYSRPWWHRGGNLYFETGSGSAPSAEDLEILSKVFDFDIAEWEHITHSNYEGITDLDYISRSYPEDSHDLNSQGLRSKPIGLYMDLFRPVMPAGKKNPRALILYGGSGNAAIAAEALGYDVTVVEQDAARAKRITAHAEKLLPKWTARAKAYQPTLVIPAGVQPSLPGAD